MNVLLNCSIIKRVHLRLETSPIELEIVYIDEQGSWWVREKLDDINMRSREYIKEKYKKAYNTIKTALLNKESFVEIEI